MKIIRLVLDITNSYTYVIKKSKTHNNMKIMFIDVCMV